MTRADKFEQVFGYRPAIDGIICNENDWCGENDACNYCICNSENIGRAEDWWNAEYKEPTTKNNPVTDIIKKLEQMLYTESTSICKRFTSQEITTFTATIKTLQYIQNNETILDKIRAEIEALNPVDYVSISSYEGHRGARDMQDDVLGIIDKYKAEAR